MSPAERIVPGVWQIGLGFVNAFALERDDGVTLIDAGCPVNLGEIRSAIGPLGDLRRIAITHYHADHVGSLAGLADSGVEVYAPSIDAPGIRGDKPVPQLEVPEDFRRLHGADTGRCTAGSGAAGSCRR